MVKKSDIQKFKKDSSSSVEKVKALAIEKSSSNKKDKAYRDAVYELTHASIAEVIEERRRHQAFLLRTRNTYIRLLGLDLVLEYEKYGVNYRRLDGPATRREYKRRKNEDHLLFSEEEEPKSD